jgi:hypothetical protein
MGTSLDRMVLCQDEVEVQRVMSVKNELKPVRLIIRKRRAIYHDKASKEETAFSPCLPLSRGLEEVSGERQSVFQNT